ncbi:hypothetical protein HQQ94_11725 [Shewanella sp. VB17]|uniref:hypothetical protein n=1 Tax=Shewanella sp. VB17 TaxID=2739432 RepID=UPI001563C044|nr:hypothetical protein [Shewanella sp. VB17]NRD73892.1 hypothetical protein [Shewanella sp. VB17]
MTKYKPLVMVSVLALSACGGGGSGAKSPIFTPSPPSLLRCEQSTELNIITTASSVEFVTEQNYIAYKTGAIIAQLNNRDSTELTFTWQQLSGSPIILASVKSPVLAFQLAEAGNYAFSVNIKSSDLNHTETIELTAYDATFPHLNIRSAHQVVEGNNVSFRIDPMGSNKDRFPSNITWCISSGPELTLDTTNIKRPQFIAPNVATDSISILRATGTLSGKEISGEVLALITNEVEITSQYFDQPIAKTFAYRETSPYAKAIQTCVYSNQLASPCTLAKLPLLGQVAETLNNDMILDRVLVSHQWMGDNFATFIATMDPNSDFANLLRSVTAIVISYDIRPSFYWVLTGAIYLDPSDLWLLAEERDSINEAADFRSDFSHELDFIMPWRYVKDNVNVTYTAPRSTRTNRTLAEMFPDFSALLYHELAHANDFFPSTFYADLNMDNQTLQDHYQRRVDTSELISDQMTAQFPILSHEMLSLATVSFKGLAATSVQKNYLASDITHFFSNDVTNDYYAYSSSREDMAMLFEEAMMSYRYGIVRDIGVTDRPENPSADTIIVDWGQRGRISQNSLQDKAAFVIDNIFPNLNGTDLISSLPKPISMKQGNSWSENLSISSLTSVNKNNIPQKDTAVNLPQFRFSGDRHKQQKQ